MASPSLNASSKWWPIDESAAFLLVEYAPAFGLKSGAHGRLQPVPKEQRAIRMLKHPHAKGHSLREIAHYAHWLPSENDTRYLDRLSAARQAAGHLNGDFVRTSKRG